MEDIWKHREMAEPRVARDVQLVRAAPSGWKPQVPVLALQPALGPARQDSGG